MDTHQPPTGMNELITCGVIQKQPVPPVFGLSFNHRLVEFEFKLRRRDSVYLHGLPDKSS